MTTRTPTWNKVELTCPKCRRHFAPNQIRIVRRNNQWWCHRCALEAKTVARTARTIGTTVRAADVIAGMPTNCATCHQPFGHRRRVINTDGQHVHYRCPRRRDG
jgi:cytochrome c553